MEEFCDKKMRILWRKVRVMWGEKRKLQGENIWTYVGAKIDF